MGHYRTTENHTFIASNMLMYKTYVVAAQICIRSSRKKCKVHMTGFTGSVFHLNNVWPDSIKMFGKSPQHASFLVTSDNWGVFQKKIK